MLTHYIFVRNDLPLGVLAAMVTHAAGESAALYQDPYDGRFRGATAVVLEVPDEEALSRVEGLVFEANVQYVAVVERDGTYAGQLMAIGVVPMDRERGTRLFSTFPVLKSCLDNSGPTLVDSQNPKTNESNQTTS